MPSRVLKFATRVAKAKRISKLAKKRHAGNRNVGLPRESSMKNRRGEICPDKTPGHGVGKYVQTRLPLTDEYFALQKALELSSHASSPKLPPHQENEHADLERWPPCFICGTRIHPGCELRLPPKLKCPHVSCASLECFLKLHPIWLDIQQDLEEDEESLRSPACWRHAASVDRP